MTVLAPPYAIDPLIAEAKERARRRRLFLLAAMGLLAVSLAGIELRGHGTSGSPGAVPWLPTKPSFGLRTRRSLRPVPRHNFARRSR
jgi:hypothetical protein